MRPVRAFWRARPSRPSKETPKFSHRPPSAPKCLVFSPMSTNVMGVTLATVAVPLLAIGMQTGCSISARSIVIALAVLAAFDTHAADLPIVRTAPSAAAQPQDSLDLTRREDVEAFVDGFMAARLSAGPIAGATVAIVKDGTVLFAKGYGYADVATRVPVDAEQTLFRPGSVAKLVTATAVMQLVEQGRLDLDADVNTYLTDFKIPAAHSGPVTLRNLLTHSAGFEDGGIGYMMPETAEDAIPLATWLSLHMPSRARPPVRDFASGVSTSYSNWGAALAGHIVEIVSGMPYDEYVERHIVAPLGMTRSTFREPLPSALAASLSGAYRTKDGAFQQQPFELIHHAAPAGSMSTTATDMARFMLSFLQRGALDGERILAPETVDMMLGRVLSPDPAVNGGGLGFYETRINGRVIVGHGGDTLYFHSVLSLLPEAGLGVFASTNTGGRGLGAAAEEFAKAFIQHYFPASLPRIEPPSDASIRNARYAGTYRSLRRSYTRLDKVFAAFKTFEVKSMPDGTLLFPDPLWHTPARWIETGDAVFRNATDDVFVAFKFERGGERASHLVGPFSPTAAERVPWYETRRLHTGIIGLGLVLFITIGVSAIRQRRADRAASQALRWARPVLALAGALLIAFVLGFGLMLANTSRLYFFNVPTYVYVTLTLPLLALLPVSAALGFAVISWRQRAWGLGARWHYTVTTLAAIAVLWSIHCWNLLGYRFG